MMTTTNHYFCSHCHGPCRLVDASGTSKTLRCRKCRLCTLRLDLPAISTPIPLGRFHLDRGEGRWLRPYDDLRLATELVESVIHSSPLTAEMVENFGIRTVRHSAALTYAVQYGVTAYDLDRAMGDGRALTCLIGRMPYQPFPDLRFPSDYEMILEDQECVWPGCWRDDG